MCSAIIAFENRGLQQQEMHVFFYSLQAPGENYVSIPGFSSVQVTFVAITRGMVNNGTGETTDR